MHKIAVVVTRGSLNSLVQVVTFLMSATVANAAVRVLFRDEAVLSVTVTGARQLQLSYALRGREAAIRERLTQHAMHDLPAMLQTVKGHGDVQLAVCSSSMALYGVTKAELLPEIDQVQGLTAFVIDEIGTADRVLTF